MANNIALAEKFVPVIDGIYKKGSLTAALDATVKPDFTGTNTVKVMKVTATGLGDYSRENGYAKGNATVEWEALKLEEDRSAELNVDRMDDEETLGQAFGMLMNEFVRTNVVPEVDAYRFAKYAEGAGTTKAADLATGAEALKAIDEAAAVLDEAEAPEDRVLFVSTALKPMLMEAIAREFGSDGKVSRVLNGYNDMQIVYVPASRFYTGITLNSGASSWGFAKGSGAKAINFLMVSKSAVMQATKMALPKVFTPDENQDKDAWKFQYRLYHDAMVYENKAKGVYAHTATT
jgi:hypothetical protein